MAMGLARLILVQLPWAYSSLRNLKFDLQWLFRGRSVTPVARATSRQQGWSVNPI
jgi:hypothetical protein